MPLLDRARTTAAIDAAHRALPAWRARPAKERSRVLRRWFDLVTEHAEDLARLIVLEEGKPFAEAVGEVAYAASFLEWFAEEAKRIRGDVLAAPEALAQDRRPQGAGRRVRGDHPVELPRRDDHPQGRARAGRGLHDGPQARRADPADRAGARPNSPTGRVFRRACSTWSRRPARDRPRADAATPLVRKVTFTGSTEVGRLLLAQAARTVKKTSMELGGNAPVLVFDDADLDAGGRRA